MLHDPHVTTLAAVPTAVVRMKIPREQIREVMGPAIGEAVGAIQAQGIGPTGPMLSRHFQIDPAFFDFEVGFPVSAPVTPTGRVIASEVPALHAAVTVYEGDHEGLGGAWGEFKTWIAAQGLRTAPGLVERYLSGPESGQPPEKWRTELIHPLAD